MMSIASSLLRTASRARTPARTILTRNLRSSAILPFHSATPRRASEAGGGASFDGPSVPLYDRLHASPAALAAIENLAELIKRKSGVDLQGGDAPSLKLMGQLANDPELRSAAETLMGALRDAGIDVNPREAFKALQTMGGKDFERVGDLDDYNSGGFNEGDDEGKKGGK